MGIFSTGGFDYYSEPLDIENMSYTESTFDDPFEAGMHLVAESEYNYNKIMKAVALDELYVLESTGSEMVYESGRISGFLNKVKEFFKKLWEKVKGIFAKFIAMINSYAQSDKDFVKKYKPILTKIDPKNFSYKGFVFTVDKGGVKKPDGSNLGGVKLPTEIQAMKNDDSDDGLKKYIAKFEDDALDNVLDNFRGTVIGSNDSIDSSDFADELFEVFRNNEKTPEVIDDITRSDIIKALSVIENTSDSKKKAEKSLKDFKKEIDTLIKQYDNAEKTALKQNNEDETLKATALSVSSNVYKEAMNINQLYLTAKLKAIKDENRQCKSMCVKLIGYKPKQESGFVHTEGGSYLDMVEFR